MIKDILDKHEKEANESIHIEGCLNMGYKRGSLKQVTISAVVLGFATSFVIAMIIIGILIILFKGCFQCFNENYVVIL